MLDAVVGDDASITCGLILLDAHGGVGVAHRSAHMSHAYARGDGPIHVGHVAGETTEVIR